jgi:PAS domain-containing protein
MLRVTLGSIGDRGDHHRYAWGHHVPECCGGTADRLVSGRRRTAAGARVPDRQRRHTEPVDNPAVKALRDGAAVGLANHTLLVRKDGSEIAIDDSAAPIADENGVVSGCVLIFRDVSERRRLERAAAERLNAANLLASIVESSDDAIVRKSLDGTIQSWNAGADGCSGTPRIRRSAAIFPCLFLPNAWRRRIASSRC